MFSNAAAVGGCCVRLQCYRSEACLLEPRTHLQAIANLHTICAEAPKKLIAKQTP